MNKKIIFLSAFQTFLFIATFLVFSGLICYITPCGGPGSLGVAFGVLQGSIIVHTIFSIFRPGKHKLLTWAISLFLTFLVWAVFMGLLITGNPILERLLNR